MNYPKSNVQFYLVSFFVSYYEQKINKNDYENAMQDTLQNHSIDSYRYEMN